MVRIMRKRIVGARRAVIIACLSCKLCNKFLKEATTIIECFHTFCKKCIEDKITEEELECCPVCNVDLGVNPFEKMRPDNPLQELRNKIFPLKRKKERSLSSLYMRTPRLSAPVAMPTRRITKPERKASGLKDSSLSIEKPLNHLVEAASRSKSFKSNVRGSDAELELMKENDSYAQVLKAKCKGNKRKVKDDTAKSNKLAKAQRKEEPVFGCSSMLPQALFYDNDNKPEASEIWFSLIASENQEGDAPLPQIASHYAIMKDGSVPVLYMHKFLRKKLGLESEDEVEITCMGQPVDPTTRAEDLVNVWLHVAYTGHPIPAEVGSAKDFVKVLNYGRKVPHP